MKYLTATGYLKNKEYDKAKDIFTALGDYKDSKKKITDIENRIINTSKNAQKPVNFTIEMEDGSVMKGELYPDIAPITVENFIKLCDEDFYAGLIFHRVIAGFMIQGGGDDTDLNDKDADTIKGEFSSNGVENNLSHTRGVISMARTPVPDSASSQFFIMHADYPALDGQYAAFGKITDGLEVIDKIANVETQSLSNGMDDVPIEPQIIKAITIDR